MDSLDANLTENPGRGKLSLFVAIQNDLCFCVTGNLCFIFGICAMFLILQTKNPTNMLKKTNLCLIFVFFPGSIRNQ